MKWQAHTSHQIRQQRAKMLADIRAFFQQRKVLEVETPALSQAGNTDPFIESFQSDHRYLHTSPEYPMKRLLASGSGDIYQICKVWRKEQAGRYHNPEFTLLEWYRVGFNYFQLMQETAELLQVLLGNKLKKEQQLFTYEEIFLEKLGINPHIASHDELIHCASENISGLSCEGLEQQAILDALLTHCIEPTFAKDRLTFIYNYPASQSALAQLHEEKDIQEKYVKKGGDGFLSKDSAPRRFFVAERFEVYLGQMELGNGYQEELGYERNKHILQSENRARSASKLKTVTLDQRFLAACKSGIPLTSGIAMGLDRVLMCITDQKSIQKVINFPWDEA